jgi:hypothetical protein
VRIRARADRSWARYGDAAAAVGGGGQLPLASGGHSVELGEKLLDEPLDARSESVVLEHGVKYQVVVTTRDRVGWKGLFRSAPLLWKLSWTNAWSVSVG